MSPRKWRHRIKDILQAISKIETYAHGMDLASFENDPKTIDAVIRNLIIIGEAASHLPEEVTQANPEIPWRLMADMRNFAVHEYWGVELSIVWETIVNDMPPLVARLEDVLKRTQGEP
ncbi:MAG: DUF86 domain-containing protein [Deltaproteobacteria bacterium]|nr:DUF86 domain-containing protein [Deltaproteobacteria bacterium]